MDLFFLLVILILWGVGDYRIWLGGEDDFEYTIDLIRQSYQKQSY